MKTFQKIISILIVGSFLLSSVPIDRVAFAATQGNPAESANISIKELASSLDKIVIPKDSGIVKSKFTGQSGKLVIHIQDAHCNFEAQTNISKIVENLVRNYNLKLVSVEGADGIIDTTWFKAFPDEEVRKEVASYFMKKGEITGPEYLAITTDYPINLFGAETRSYYIQNLNAFTTSYPLKAETEKYYNEIKSALGKLKNYIYNDDLKAMDSKSQDYESKKIQFNEYVRFLQTMSEKCKINLRTYDGFFKLMSVLIYEKKIDFTVTDKERSALIDELSKTISKDALTELISQSLAFKVNKISASEYYSYLRSVATKNGIDVPTEYPNLYNYIIYNAIYSRIDNERLFKDIKALETDIKEKLFVNDDQKTLEKLSRHIDILLGLINIKLMNGDFDYYKSHKDEFSYVAFTDFIKAKSTQYGLTYAIDPPEEAVAKNMERMEDFYAIATKRDKALVDNTVNEMNTEKQDIAVLVTGGFHSEGIAKLLEKQGISYMVVCPNITKDVPTPYIQILTNQRVSFEDILTDTAAQNPKQGMVAIYSRLKAFIQGFDNAAAGMAQGEKFKSEMIAMEQAALALWIRHELIIENEPVQVLKDRFISDFEKAIRALRQERGKPLAPTYERLLSELKASAKADGEFDRIFTAAYGEADKSLAGAAGVLLMSRTDSASKLSPEARKALSEVQSATEWLKGSYENAKNFYIPGGRLSPTCGVTNRTAAEIQNELDNEIYGPIFAALKKIEALIRAGKINPAGVNLRVSEKDGPATVSKDIKRPIRWAGFGLKGDPWQDGHIYCILEAIATGELDKVIVTTDNSDPRKENLSSLAIREPVTRALLARLGSLVQYSNLPREEKGLFSADAETTLFRLIELNKDVPTEIVYHMAGSDHRYWEKKNAPDVPLKLVNKQVEGLYGYVIGKSPKVTALFSQRPTEKFADGELEALGAKMRSIVPGAVTPLKYDQPMDTSATRVRNEQHFWTVPWDIRNYAEALKFWGFEKSSVKEGEPLTWSAQQDAVEERLTRLIVGTMIRGGFEYYGNIETLKRYLSEAYGPAINVVDREIMTRISGSAETDERTLRLKEIRMLLFKRIEDIVAGVEGDTVGAVRLQGGEYSATEHGPRTYKNSAIALTNWTPPEVKESINADIRKHISSGNAYSILIGKDWIKRVGDADIKLLTDDATSEMGLASLRNELTKKYGELGYNFVVIKGPKPRGSDMILHFGVTRGHVYIYEEDLLKILSVEGGLELLVSEGFPHEIMHIENPDWSEEQVEAEASTENFRKLLYKIYAKDGVNVVVEFVGAGVRVVAIDKDGIRIAETEIKAIPGDERMSNSVALDIVWNRVAALAELVGPANVRGLGFIMPLAMQRGSNEAVLAPGLQPVSLANVQTRFKETYPNSTILPTPVRSVEEIAALQFGVLPAGAAVTYLNADITDVNGVEVSATNVYTKAAYATLINFSVEVVGKQIWLKPVQGWTYGSASSEATGAANLNSHLNLAALIKASIKTEEGHKLLASFIETEYKGGMTFENIARAAQQTENEKVRTLAVLVIYNAGKTLGSAYTAYHSTLTPDQTPRIVLTGRLPALLGQVQENGRSVFLEAFNSAFTPKTPDKGKTILATTPSSPTFVAAFPVPQRSEAPTREVGTQTEQPVDREREAVVRAPLGAAVASPGEEIQTEGVATSIEQIAATIGAGLIPAARTVFNEVTVPSLISLKEFIQNPATKAAIMKDHRIIIISWDTGLPNTTASAQAVKELCDVNGLGDFVKHAIGTGGDLSDKITKLVNESGGIANVRAIITDASKTTLDTPTKMGPTVQQVIEGYSADGLINKIIVVQTTDDDGTNLHTPVRALYELDLNLALTQLDQAINMLPRVGLLVDEGGNKLDPADWLKKLNLLRIKPMTKIDVDADAAAQKASAELTHKSA